MNFHDKNDEDLPPSIDDLTLALTAHQTSGSASREVEFTAEDYKTALRLLVGAMLEGNDELRYRTKTLLTNIQKEEQEIDASILDEETGGSSLLYAFIGLLSKTPHYLSGVTSAAGRASSGATSLVSRFTRPITNSRVMRPVWRRYNVLVERGESVVSSFEKIGRSKASSSRALIRKQVNDEAVEELLVYMVEKSKMREMIVETSAEVGGDALVEIRGRTASVDSSLDNFVDNILRRRKLITPPSSSSS
jgi:hypothetical protein